MKKDLKEKPTWLLGFGANVYSQTGEDGIIAKILDILPVQDNWCVEFGASDGIHASNTRNLIEKKNYNGIFIEGNEVVFNKLQKNYQNHKKVTCIEAVVGFDKKNNLDHILKTTTIPVDFDFLSIDIDGNDFHVWQAMQTYKPKVICVEFNPTIPTEVLFVQPPNPQITQGSSLLS